MLNVTAITRVLSFLDTECTVIAVGSGSSPIYSAEYLTNETFRNVVSSSTISNNTLIKEIYIDTASANGPISEVGLFGNGASLASNSGDLMASFSTSLFKDSSQSLNIAFEIDVLEVV
jgi:hypothetical protein